MIMVRMQEKLFKIIASHKYQSEQIKKVAQNRVKPKQDKMLEYEKKTQIRNIFKMYDVNQMVCKSLTN